MKLRRIWMTMMMKMIPVVKALNRRKMKMILTGCGVSVESHITTVS
jgi:NAD-dependent SIR2 family protein deacetylase